MTALKTVCFYSLVVAVFFCAPFVARDLLMDQPIIVSMSDRMPSSIQKVFDYSGLAGSALQSAARQRLMDSIQITAKNGDVVIQMGNFVLLNDNQQKDFACGYYNKMSFEFEAQGVLVEGEKPTLTLVTGCEVSGNINFMTPFKVPVAQLKSQKPSPADFKFFESGNSMTVSLHHSPATWPTQWVLKNIKMSHTQMSARSLVIPTEQISMKW